MLLSGGYYTIEQTKSRLRIIALNTNYMRHDIKYSQSHSSAVKQRPDGSINYGQPYHHHEKHYHRNSDNRYYSQSSLPYNSHASPPSGVSGFSRSSFSNMDASGGGQVSALSGSNSHESEKQWEWLEDVLAKSSKNKETVSRIFYK